MIRFKKGYIYIAGLSLVGIATYLNFNNSTSIEFGNMDNWIVREIKESLVIGGKTKLIYEIGSSKDTLRGNKPYKNNKSPWATSSVMANMKGVITASTTVFPEKRGSGYAARLETKIERIKVLGVVNINVIAGGTIFLGEMLEPINDTKNPQQKIISGIPYTKKPEYLQFDYKVNTGGTVIKLNGIGNGTETKERDKAEVFVLLQNRWEDNKGNVFAKRIGTAWHQFENSNSNWQNKYKLKINYGNISKAGFFRPYMDLKNNENSFYTKNSKGIVVPIIESNWGAVNEAVTHIILQFSSSSGEPYRGNEKSKLWVDNIELIN